MRGIFHAFAMCHSMFCAIPFPGHIWDEKVRDKMMVLLPFVGLEIGLLWWGIGALCRFLSLPAALTALVLSVYPFLVTGFIHLDGFMDVKDAVGSCRDLDRRREILKDSHVGSFAVIGMVILGISQFAVFLSVPEDADLRALIFIPVVSRCCSCFANTVLKPMTTSQYARQKKPASNWIILLITLGAAAAAAIPVCGKYALVIPGVIAGNALAVRKGYKNLEGMNGDISGYALTLSELAGILVLALL